MNMALRSEDIHDILRCRTNNHRSGKFKSVLLGLGRGGGGESIPSCTSKCPSGIY